ncbi:hypothetical protein D3C80_2032610 [compost metagenome]
MGIHQLSAAVPEQLHHYRARAAGDCVRLLHCRLQAGPDQNKMERRHLFPLHHADADSVPVDHADSAPDSEKPELV